MRYIEQIIFTLTKAQYFEYLTYQVKSIKSIEMYKIVTTWSLPVTMFILLLILKKSMYQWILLMLFISVVWLYLITILWIKKIIPKATEKLYNRLNIEKYVETVLCFESDEIIVQGSKTIRIPKSDITHCIFGEKVIIVYYGNAKALVIPQDAFNQKSNALKFLLNLSRSGSKPQIETKLKI